MKKNPKSKDIAVIGMACRFPGANSIDEFWDNLCDGVDSIEVLTDRWDIGKYYSEDVNAKNKTTSKWYGLLDDITQFDNKFFNLLGFNSPQLCCASL